MMLVTALAWLTLGFYFVCGVFCFAVGLFYLSELVEEYTTLTGRIIRYTIIGEIVLHIALLVFEDLPWSMVLTGLIAHIVYSNLLRTFPAFQFTSPGLIISSLFVILLHYFAFSYFGEVLHPFDEVLGYFTVCIWLVPFMFLVSLSANDLVLPQTDEGQRVLNTGGITPLFDDGDFVSAYLKGKRKGLFYFLSNMRDRLTPGKKKREY